jgi:hypothetical protein
MRVLFMDLSPKTENKKRTKLLLVFGLAVVAIGYLTVRSPSSGEHSTAMKLQNARLVGVEEKQTVVFVLDQLENDLPKLSPVIREIRTRVLERPTWVAEREMENTNLVWNNTEGLVFSFRFFTSDLYTQSNSILRIIDPGHMHLVFNPDPQVKLPD